MKEKDEFFKTFFFAIFTILVFVTFVVTILTYKYHHTNVPVFNFAIKHHLSIMVVSIFVALAYGFFWSRFLSDKLKKSEIENKNMLDIVMKFLSREEKMVITLLVENNGKAKQSEISKLNNMGRVKALRTVQKMQEKNLVKVVPHGKQRIIELKENIFDLLR